MSNLKFSQDWNGKLKSRKFFTTIRIPTNYYKVGRTYSILVNEKKLGTATIEKMYFTTLPEIPELFCYLDTGYNKADTESILKRMYPKHDMNRDKLVVILLKWHK